MARQNLQVVLFSGFELLDVCGPLEMFGRLPDYFNIKMLAEKPGAIASAGGPKMMAEFSFAESNPAEILFIPGGIGTHSEINNKSLISWLLDQATHTKLAITVCTGSALLAATGILDNYQATTNKRAFHWVTQQGPKVKWVKQARWVEDGKFITSSGVAAGIDMALAVIAKLHGDVCAEKVAYETEYVWNRNSTDDPFSKELLLDVS